MKIIDGEGIVLGRLSSYAAKEALNGEDIAIINCEKIIITGNKKNIGEKFHERRSRVGASQKGPRHSKTNEKIVKRAIRGMLPDFRMGRGKIAFKKIKCYAGTPKEFRDSKKVEMEQSRKIKFSLVKEFAK